MTSQLHKKHPTTPANTLPLIRIKSRWLLSLVTVILSLTTSLFAQDDPFLDEPFEIEETTTSSDQPSPLQRLKSRSASSRFQQMHSNWKSGSEFDVIKPETKPQISQSAHIIEVLDVDSFRKTPQYSENKRYSENQLQRTSLQKQDLPRQLSIYHLLEKEEPMIKTNQLPLNQPIFGNVKSIPVKTPQPVQQQPVLQRREYVFDKKEALPAEMNSPRDLKKITEILPYHDFNSSKESRISKGKLPKEVALSQEGYAGRYFADTFFQWEASNIQYNPLYFEDVQLERYGHTYPQCIQPFVSVSKFGAQLIGLPYQMGIDSPHKPVSPLGYYRPAEPAPKLCYQIPFNTKAAAIQAGTVTGLIYLIP